MHSHDWRQLYPFTSRWLTLPGTSARLHYLDEGAGRPVVLLHGNPTWSFMYRDLVKALVQAGFRALAPDHLGCGWSDKPQDAAYTLEAHCQRFAALVEVLQLPPFDLVVHDWGGPVGLLYAERHPQQVRRIVLMNTIAWASRQFPKAIYLTKCPVLGAFLVRHCHLLMRVALKCVPCRPLPQAVEAGYRAPYASYHDRIAIQRFPQDIPLGAGHPSHGTFLELERNLPRLRSHPLLALWGEVDFCFPPSFLQRWQELFPGHLQMQTFPEASHLLLEDQPEQVIPPLIRFLEDADGL